MDFKIDGFCLLFSIHYLMHIPPFVFLLPYLLLAASCAALRMVGCVLCCSAIGWLSPVLVCDWLAKSCAGLSLVDRGPVLICHWLAASCAGMSSVDRVLCWSVIG
jgi:hypothetical protein